MEKSGVEPKFITCKIIVLPITPLPLIIHHIQQKLHNKQYYLV